MAKIGAVPQTQGRPVCFTLDLEEDYGGMLPDYRYECTDSFPEVVAHFERWKAPLSVFVAGNLLRNRPAVISPYPMLDLHSHGDGHAPHAQARRRQTREANIRNGLTTFREFFGRASVGYRAPFGFLEPSDFAVLQESGVRFDGSLFPGWHISGFHPFRTSRPYPVPGQELWEIPITAVPFLRIPCSFSYVKLIGVKVFLALLRWKPADCPIVFDFHLHDLVSTRATETFSPFWKRIYGSATLVASLRMLEEIASGLQAQGGRFISLSRLYAELMGARHA
jgi:hypothetical protein